MTERLDLKGLYLEEIIATMTEVGQPKFRAKQIAEWIYQKKAASFFDMTNLPKDLRELLDAKFALTSVRTIKRQIALDGTEKFLFSMRDNNAVESVLMRYEHGNSVCVSTQVGCGMNCSFCASGLGGLVRNLSAGEILDQVLQIDKLLAEKGQKVTHVVIMGSGEPLANYDNVLKFIRLLNKEYCLGISFRRITISTCGLVPQILKLAEEDIPITLSISLHAPNDEKRSKIMPVNKQFPINELINACRAYIEKTGRRISFEYTLIDGVNDKTEDAETLAKLLKGGLFHVNLIPVNPVSENGFRCVKPKQLETFQRILTARGIAATVRRTCGEDIDAACGQLRRKVLRGEIDGDI